MRFALLLLALTGCGDFSRLPNQDLAEQVIWREVYGMTEDPPPVEWVHSSETSPGYQGITLPWGVRCACRWIAEADGPCDMRIEQSAYAHELLHWRAWLQLGDLDPLHFREDWNLPYVALDAFAARLN
jgi:hypothetical protein